MLGKTIQPEIRELIQKRELSILKEVFEDWHPSELADLINDLPETERAIVFRILPKDKAADTFEYLDIDTQKEFLKGLAQEEVATILNEMSPDDRTALLEELPGTVVKQLIELLTPQERTIATTLLGYPEDSVGRLMSPDYIAVEKDWTVQQVLNYIREHGKDIESFDMIYIVDEKGRLVDDIRLRDILLANPNQKIFELSDGSFISLQVTDKKESVVPIFRQYDRTVLPVVNYEGFLLGIVTIDDVLDVIEESDTEDIQKFGGVAALEYPYVKTPLFQMIKKRAGWLVILFIGEMLTATAMGYFEHEIAKAVVLALFVPLIISSGGNSGSQAATLIVRALTLGELTVKDWWKVMRREIKSGLALGSILGAIGFLRITVWTLFTDIYGPHWPLIATTIFFALVGVVTWGTFAGSMLPILLKKLGLDPAVSSAPFVATIVDVTGIVIYFSVASIILAGSLL
ncbi:MAG: Mg/Co/Ni transporter MgtE / CBS domain [Ignavibacteriae bacterium]|nr:MAG: Mg/Co/Ni transporter MgtE / CBS domain [Ignavibacteriota bacterium]